MEEHWMREAIKEAKKADFPYGAVIVKENKIIAKAGTANRKNLDPTAHAEITAIRKACKKLNTPDLTGTILYTTCEPCPMCFTAAWWAKISKIVFGINLEDSSKLMGQELELKSEYLNKIGGEKIKITGGVLKKEIIRLFNNK